MIKIEVTNQQSRHAIDESQIQEVARAVLQGEGIKDAELSIAIVDLPTMHALNLEHLNHDYPTDVLSFLYGEGDAHVDGEIIVCAAVAAEAAQDYDWQFPDELALYVAHGVLHLAGYDDGSPAAREEMRKMEWKYLQQFNLHPRYEQRGSGSDAVADRCNSESIFNSSSDQGSV